MDISGPAFVEWLRLAADYTRAVELSDDYAQFESEAV